MKNVCSAQQASGMLMTVNMSLEQLRTNLDMQLTPFRLLCQALQQLVGQHQKHNSTFLSNSERDIGKKIWNSNIMILIMMIKYAQGDGALVTLNGTNSFSLQKLINSVKKFLYSFTDIC